MRRKWTLLALLVSSLCILVIAASRRKSSRASAEQTPAGKKPIVFAHRGASADFPENTLAAFGAGLAEGASHLEMDVHMTRDGHVLVIHDGSVARTTDGSGFVRDMTLAELQSLDAGGRFSADGSTRPFRGRGIHMPALGEVFREFSEARVNLEIKEARAGIEEAVLREIEAAGAEERTLVAAEKHAVLRRFRKLAGEKVATAASRREIRAFLLLSWLGLEGLARPSYVALQVPTQYRGVPIVTRRFLAAARRRGVRVDVWTINDPEEMRRLLDLGVGGIMSDRPGVLVRVLAGAENPSG